MSRVTARDSHFLATGFLGACFWPEDFFAVAFFDADLRAEDDLLACFFSVFLESEATLVAMDIHRHKALLLERRERKSR